MRLLLLTTLLVLPLAACVSRAGPRSPDTGLPAAYEAPTGAALPAAALDRWWTLFGDAELERLVETALRNSPDAQIAAARLREAEAQRRANLYLAWPEGALTGRASTSDSRVVSGDLLNFPGFSNSGGSQAYGLNFDVSWEVDLFGRVREGRRGIEADYAATRFNIEGTRASLAAAVADALFTARGLALQLADAQETARIAGELVEVARARAQRGLGASTDADRVEADRAQAQAAVVQIEAELKAARRSLLLLLGEADQPLASLTVPAAVVAALPQAPAALPGELLARRPDVREAEARVTMASAQLSLDQLALFPKFTLTPGVGLQRNDQPGFSSTTANWSLGLGVSIPILDRPKLLAQTRVSDARAEQAVIAYEKAVQTAYAEADTALVQLAADRNRVSLLAAGEARARLAYDAARRRYAAGLDDLTAVLSAEQAWRGSRTALIAAQVQALRRSVQTFKALGGGWSPAGATAA